MKRATMRPMSGYLALYLSAALFGGVTILVRLASAYYGSLFVSAVRFAIGAAISVAVLLVRDHGIRPRAPRWLLMRGLFGAASMALTYAAISIAGPGRATVLANTYPLFVALFGALFFGESFRARTFIGIGVCICGAILVARDGSSANPLGDVLALVSAVGAGFAVNAVRRAAAHDDPFMIYLSPCLFGLLLFPFARVGEAAAHAGWVGPLLLAAIGIFALLAQALMAHGYRSVSAGTGSVVFYSETILTVILGILFAGERINGRFLVGLAFILIGLRVNQSPGKPRSGGGTRARGTGLVALTALLAGFFAASCAGDPRTAGMAAELERAFERRQVEGARRAVERFTIMTAEGALPDIRAPNSEAAAAAERGERHVASAAWWLKSAPSATAERASALTAALDAAFAAPVDILLVPAIDGGWTVGPLALKGPREVVFEPGCLIQAAEGAFLGKGDCLISVEGVTGLRLIGYGARLEMRKEDYRAPPYEASQWRHALSVGESSGVQIEGFTIASSGGDGVYIGQRRGRSTPRNVILRDLHLVDHFRQGVSVIAADGFLMEDCLIEGTVGHAPQAGIDFEPNSGLYGFTDCVVRRCLFRENAGAAVHLHLTNLNAEHPPVSIRVEDSALIGSPLALWVRGLGGGAHGSLVLNNSPLDGLTTVERSATFAVERR